MQLSVVEYGAPVVLENEIIGGRGAVAKMSDDSDEISDKSDGEKNIDSR